MKFKKDSLKEAMWEGSSEDGLTLEWDSGWMGGHKGEDINYVFEFEGKYYMISDHRSGSDFSEWHYDSRDWKDEVECQEVKKVPVTTFRWVKV